MAVYPNFKHGAYGVINAQGVPTARAGEGNQAIVYIGTAPVGQTEGGAERVNVPVLVRNFAEARKLFGYSDDWAKYTLCEAMYAHFELGGVGPLVFINVLDPATHKTVAASTASLTPANGRVIIASAEDVIIDTIIRNYSEDASVVISTHLISDVENVLDDVIFLREGKVTMQASVDDIREQYGKSVDALFREVFRC